MSSSFSARTAAVAAALAIVVAAAPVAAKKPEPVAAAPTGADGKNISKAARPALMEAQKLTTAGDLPGALAQLRTVEALPGLNSTDAFFIGQLKLGVAIKQKDNKLAEEALKTIVNNEFVTPAEKPKYLRNLANFALQRNDYAGATAFFEQLAASPDASSDDLTVLAELYAKQKQMPQAMATFDKVAAAAAASGKPVPENVYARRLQLAYDGKIAATVLPASLDLVKAYPTPDNWRSTLYIFREGAKLDDQGNLDVFRLMDTADALKGERDYAEYVETAIGKGVPGEAKTILAKGIAKGMIPTSKPYVAEYTKSITTRIAADRASLAATDKEARGSATGKTALGQGDAYYGYADYAKAAEMYRLALSKGGVDAATANLRLGATLARAGDKAGAVTALQAVSGGPRATLAKFWLVWLKA